MKSNVGRIVRGVACISFAAVVVAYVAMVYAPMNRSVLKRDPLEGIGMTTEGFVRKFGVPTRTESMLLQDGTRRQVLIYSHSRRWQIVKAECVNEVVTSIEVDE